MARIEGVIVTALTPHADNRGVFTEIFRQEWNAGIAPLQWNVVTTAANVLRGVHVHVGHADYMTCVAGEIFVAMKDARRGSPTVGLVETIVLRGNAPVGLTIPEGVAHGFYSRAPSQHIYAMSSYWDVATEIGCRWDDPDLEIAWPAETPALSARDAAAGSYAQMVADFEKLRG